MDSRSQLTVDVIAKVTQGKVCINSTSSSNFQDVRP